MPGNPKECRKHAARCAELAMAAHTPHLRAMFLELSKNWEKLAIQLEGAFAKLAESQDIRSRVQETINDQRGSPASEKIVRFAAPPLTSPGTGRSSTLAFFVEAIPLSSAPCADDSLSESERSAVW